MDVAYTTQQNVFNKLGCLTEHALSLNTDARWEADSPQESSDCPATFREPY